MVKPSTLYFRFEEAQNIHQINDNEINYFFNDFRSYDDGHSGQFGGNCQRY